jgi:hypothetical protein
VRSDGNDLINAGNRIFVALRAETRAQHIGNGEVTGLLDLADALAAAVAARHGPTARESIVVARARATLAAHLQEGVDLRRAISLVRGGVDRLVV